MLFFWETILQACLEINAQDLKHGSDINPIYVIFQYLFIICLSTRHCTQGAT